jgi:hypothetical protein
MTVGNFADNNLSLYSSDEDEDDDDEDDEGIANYSINIT